MKTVGVICEYNPFHKGHGKQLRLIRQRWGEDTGIVCLMSGNFVQRGHPAILDKSLRAGAAVAAGADLVLELPVEYALSSAEGFAAGGVEILSPFCDGLCFGAENPDKESLMGIAGALLREDYPPVLKAHLERGLSFPAARQAALEEMGFSGALLREPNNILAIEYCKAILEQNASLEPLPIGREGSYHASAPDPENPSATSLRERMLLDQPWQEYVPEAAAEALTGAPLHSLTAGERAMLAKLRTMTEEEFAQVPYGSEGLWRKLMHAAREETDLERIAQAVKSKRYTRTRIDRMLLCAFLGLTREDLNRKPPYVRVLAMNDRGREILKTARRTGVFLNAGQQEKHDYWLQEQRLGALYGLFALNGPERPDAERKRRVIVREGGTNHG